VGSHEATRAAPAVGTLAGMPRVPVSEGGRHGHGAQRRCAVRRVDAWAPQPDQGVGGGAALAALLAGGGAVLAPMAGFTDAPFRRLARAYGAAWAVSEMVSARALALGDDAGLAISAPHPGERNVVLQLFAGDPAEAERAALRLVDAFQPTALDLNMGCPVRKVVQRGCGVELMRDPARAAAIVAAIDAAVPVPVTVKTRLGIDRIAAHEVVAAVVEAGAVAVAIHGRTAEQKYGGEADWDAIAEVASAVAVPVLGSGDVADADGYRLARARGLGVMIARAALGRPWVFREVLGGRGPTVEEVVAVSWRHARDHVAWYGGEHALPRLRGQLAAYAAQAGASREPFVRVSRLDDVADAWRAGLGIDPRHDDLRDLDPFGETLPRCPALATRRGRGLAA
jgi:tRNA-dihydrouridine synthase B